MAHEHPHAAARPHGAHGNNHMPHLIAWEVTRSCMLACKHCRAAARPEPYSGELSTQECFALLDNIASFAKPIIILTGGEPMLREDIYEIASHGTSLGLTMVMAPCGMLVDDEAVAKMKDAGIRCISISIDGATAESHDAFRVVPGAFDGAMKGIEAARRGGLDFQINTTVTQHNLVELNDIMKLTIDLGATIFNPFLLVPTGRGKDLADQELSPQQYEDALNWLADQQAAGTIPIRVTCAPHYQRIIRQKGLEPSARQVKGCMGGQSFAFISHLGKVQICGFLENECGDVRAEGLNFAKIWENSPLFCEMRNLDSYHGRCGYCEYRTVCGGCRARAYALTDDYLGEEPFCTHQPAKKPELDDQDKALMSVIQANFPVDRRPFERLGSYLNDEPEDLERRVKRMRDDGLIRRLGAVFDSRKLGYVSTLVAARIEPDRLDEVAGEISKLPGVTHNYRRENAYNLWFTLTCQSQDKLDATLEDLRVRIGTREIHSLPALKVFKIRVNFQFGPARDDAKAAASHDRASHMPHEPSSAPFSDEQKQLVRLLQESLSDSHKPFDEIADQLGWSVGRVLQQIEDWLAEGIIKRLGAVVRHQRLGFRANGMAVLDVPADREDQIGAALAKRPEISHCYCRPRLGDFPYGLFAMVHGRDQQTVRQLVADWMKELEIENFGVLFSTTEYKKVSMKYFLEQ
ncbi:MAG: radical SAM protein [Phycisphaerales bacterium]|jgi:heme b synthase|nr:radical SAM protein [Phycisphaerales bacterium]